MRNSDGGLLDAMAEVTGMLLQRGATLWSYRDPQGHLHETKNNNGSITDLPVSVLINKGTAGSELIALAIQQNHRGTIIGQPSSGFMSVKGLQELEKKPDGSSRMVQRGLFIFGDNGSRTNVVPDKLLPITAKDEDFFKAAREAMTSK